MVTNDKKNDSDKPKDTIKDKNKTNNGEEKKNEEKKNEEKKNEEKKNEEKKNEEKKNEEKKNEEKKNDSNKGDDNNKGDDSNKGDNSNKSSGPSPPKKKEVKDNGGPVDEKGNPFPIDNPEGGDPICPGGYKIDYDFDPFNDPINPPFRCISSLKDPSDDLASKALEMANNPSAGMENAAMNALPKGMGGSSKSRRRKRRQKSKSRKNRTQRHTRRRRRHN